mmetsp:Transcript_26225/g.40649  ORF Transcript_26225/g.40649 Transcript_26225/m.40649 type:complete len:495 (-) Transcript_26225:222-1706(-)|eukprot:CAMPEP_0196819774 /NCGR_PEP_ID=MMETSP1362-20130617/72074_1 /TAXON_ID=163516 /ORGANISM="Leptocylindrus danicus, Strain CCMP1856" /LENGTH=494 /DNA_ID=CAMNT_0042198369 /DNA_START=134 /DNA_END=1618 /DNA_ORIENTATION=-
MNTTTTRGASILRSSSKSFLRSDGVKEAMLGAASSAVRANTSSTNVRSALLVNQSAAATVSPPRMPSYRMMSTATPDKVPATITVSTDMKLVPQAAAMKQTTSNTGMTGDETLLAACRRARELVALSTSDAAANVLLATGDQICYTTLSETSRLILHRAILTTTTACLAAAKNNALAFRKALELAMFSENVGLPLIPPLYNEIAERCGHLGTVNDVFELSESINRLGLPSDYFYDSAVLGFVERERPDYKSAILVLNEMEEKHDVKLNHTTAIRMLKSIHEKVGLDVNRQEAAISDALKSNNKMSRLEHRQLTSNTDNVMNGYSDAFELVGLAVKSIDSLIQERKAASSRLASMLNEARDLTKDLDEDDEDDEEEVHEIKVGGSDSDEFDEEDLEESYWDDGDDFENDRVKEYPFAIQMMHGLRNSQGSDDYTSIVSGGQDLDASRLYVRDRDSWEIPDITLQLIAQNSGNELTFTREEEEALLGVEAEEILVE